MTQKSKTQHNGQNGAAPTQARVTATPDAEYKVGPGCPPREYQFKKGQSGNPKGARRKAPVDVGRSGGALRARPRDARRRCHRTGPFMR